jgi:hypothetical protein
MIETNSPDATVKLTPRSAWTAPLSYERFKSRASMSGEFIVLDVGMNIHRGTGLSTSGA